MQDSTLKFLEEFISDDQKKLFEENADRIRNRMSSKTDEQCFEDAVSQYTNPRPALLLAVHKAEVHQSVENIQQVVRCAVRADDFVTAQHWHREKQKRDPGSLSDKFEQYYYTLMAQQQKVYQPDSKPCASVSQMCKDASDTSRTLRDPKYLEHSVSYETQKIKAYQAKFDAMEESVLLPAKSKDENTALIQVLIGLVFLVAGGILLWNTYGPIASAIRNHFLGSILALVTWLIPPIYAIVVIIADFLLIYLVAKMVGAGNKKRTTKRISEAIREIETDLKNSPDYRALQAMNKDLASSFHTYEARLILAALSAMTGEQDLTKLQAMAKRNDTWLSQMKPRYRQGQDPYAYIDKLIQDDSSDTDLFIGYTLSRKRWAEEGLDWYESIAGLTRERRTLTPKDFEQREASDCCFIEKFYYCHFGGDHWSHNYWLMFEMLERFLLAEALNAKKRGDLSQMGWVYFVLYRLCLASEVHSPKRAYNHGVAGVDHCDEFKYYVMYNKACYDEDHEYYDPYDSLGYTRADAKAYASALCAKGDPRGRKLFERFDQVDQYTAQRAAEERAAEARAYWDERSRMRREAEEAREKARADLNARMDSMERDRNLLFGGSYATDEELLAQSDRSEMDKVMAQMRHDRQREARIRKELDDV